MLPTGLTALPCRQCAAVMSRFPAGLLTTLAVQKCAPSWPPDRVNSAPTAGVPLNGTPRPTAGLPAARASGDTAYPPSATTMKLASKIVRCQARTDIDRAPARGYLMPRRIQSSVVPVDHPRLARARHYFADPLGDCADRNRKEPESLAARMLRRYWAPALRCGTARRRDAHRGLRYVTTDLALRNVPATGGCRPA